MDHDDWHPEIVTINGVSYTRTDVAREIYATAPAIERSYTVSELVEMSGWPKSTINAAIRRGELIAVAPNGGERYRRVNESDWAMWQERMRTSTERSSSSAASH